jgi:hypothetical protein
MLKKRLKGGSLSATYLVVDGSSTFVRKEVSLSKNREYGFQRWYSQLKRMQRYNIIFPGLFPQILKYGQDKEMAYFDMEYFTEYPTAHQFLLTTSDPQTILTFTKTLIDTLNILHRDIIPSNSEAMQLYLHEEVQQRLYECQSNSAFLAFNQYDTLYFNGEMIPSFSSQLTHYYDLFCQYTEPTETFSHGNLTLENMLYSPTNNKLVLIDPYEENIIDSRLADYSQIYQSCHAFYEMYNDQPVKIHNNHINCDILSNYGINYFNIQFNEYTHNICNDSQFQIIRLLEISQFIRMLPFKMALDPDRMILFYGLASKLLHDLQSYGGI